MIRPYLPLNGLRAFEAAARHLSFTKAAVELSVTPAALSHQVKALEERIGLPLFRRLPRGLALTDEGHALLPVTREAFDRMAQQLAEFDGANGREVVSVGVVGTFALRWLLKRLADFEQRHPEVDLRITTNNNRVDIAEEGLDFAIRFGDGAWNGTDSVLLKRTSFTPLTTPRIAATLQSPTDLLGCNLLRSYRVDEWPTWFEAAGVAPPRPRGAVFDSAALMVEAALNGHGVALGPSWLFADEVQSGRAARPFTLEVDLGSYWLTRLKSRQTSAAMTAFQNWLVSALRT